MLHIYTPQTRFERVKEWYTGKTRGIFIFHLERLLVNVFINNFEQLFAYWVNLESINTFQPSVEFHLVTSHLLSSAKPIRGFHIKRETGLKWVFKTLH